MLVGKTSSPQRCLQKKVHLREGLQGALNFFSDRGVQPKFLKCIFASERGVLHVLKFSNLWA